ncbi:ZIP family metal transporter [Phycisphaera mikurensis]|uniref:Putative transporter n=1 Tax=Phycisphaera mikurensis (strain NBRC 102666 / KCTC 22515 / FYK2301M01) TaxID=1142394 RepID=I0IGB6_PHYMF|nr:ZIP family metal transporter [Phycisphaera mikurensis]MBB6440316.1 zinc and cadmium transporter [Phycisphaera mikurensis]BAM04304.1 putative transporter [Phycisphaera mikurensis NBRC 102666]
MSPTTLILLYCLAILGASLLGGLLPLFLRLGHTGTQVMMSAVAGFMLGVAVLHMLGHALPEASSTQAALLWLLGGFLMMFFTERFFAWHHHDLPGGHMHAAGETGHGHEHDERAAPVAAPAKGRMHWAGALVGMSIHSLVSGIALAAAVAAGTLGDPGGGEAGGLAGLAVLLAILGHKPLDALTVVGLAHASGIRLRRAHLLNAGFALVEPLGVLAAWWGLTAFFHSHPGVTPAALAFSAGTFLCIALSDLLPEVQFHKHDRLKLSFALLLGLSAAWGIGLLEGDHHHHGHAGHGAAANHADHPHEDGHAHRDGHAHHDGHGEHDHHGDHAHRGEAQRGSGDHAGHAHGPAPRAGE